MASPTKKVKIENSLQVWTPKCAFCHQKGLLPHEIPLNDEERKIKNGHRVAALDPEQNTFDGRPMRYETEYECKYGGWLQDSEGRGQDLSSHLFCLLASPALFEVEDEDHEHYVGGRERQRGSIEQLGFHRNQILAECRRAAKLKCCFCRKPGANVGCAHAKCQKKFHAPCAQEADYAFVNDNKRNSTFCPKHMTKEYRFAHSKGQPDFCLDIKLQEKSGRFTLVDTPNARDNAFFLRVQKSLQPYSLSSIEQDEPECTLCGATFDQLHNIVIGHCCLNSAFHRKCLSKYAVNCGRYNYKCPHCGIADRVRFLRNSVAQGVYCPVRDASWEIDNEFDDQLEINRKVECSKVGCKNKDEMQINGSRYEVIPCKYCGAHGIHVDCDKRLLDLWLNEKCREFEWNCSACNVSSQDSSQSSQEI